MYQQTWRESRYGACGLLELGKTIDSYRSGLDTVGVNAFVVRP
ncbi:MAG: hypothetical protein ACI4QS_01695 [Comamonas sp.]